MPGIESISGKCVKFADLLQTSAPGNAMLIAKQPDDQADFKSLHILENSSGRLVARQTPYSADFTSYLFILIAAGILIRLLWKRQFKRAVIPAGMILFSSMFLLFPETPTYTLTLNRETRTLNSEARVKDIVQSRFIVSANDLNSAEMQFGHGSMTIVLVRRDGSILYPLGEQQLQNEPDQYVVLNAIRQMIGQVPQHEPSP